MPECNEEWSGRSLTRSVDGQWTATRVWFVVDAIDENAALGATPVAGSDPIPADNVSHPLNANLKVRSRNAATDGGPRSWKVTVSYGIPGTTGGTIDPNPNPLQRKPRLSMANGVITIPTDRDVLGHKYVNSAGSPYNPGGSRRVRIKSLICRFFAPFYDQAAVQTYEDTINSQPFNWGTLQVAPGNAHFAEIGLIGEYTNPLPTEAPYVEIQAQIDIALDRSTTSPKLPFFFNYLKDQGRTGWYDVSGTKKSGAFWYASGLPVQDDIALDGTGKPFDSTITVEGRPPLSPPAGIANDGNFTAITPNGTTNFKMWKFQENYESNFNGFFQGLGISLA